MNNTLADRYTAKKAQSDLIAKELDVLKKEIKAEGRDVLEGDHCTVTLSLSERITLDTKLVTQFLTATQIAACTKTSLIETIRIKAKVTV